VEVGVKTSRVVAFAAGLLAIGVLLGCCVPKASEDSTMLTFVFEAASNPGVLSADATATISGGDVAVTVPAGTVLTALVPTITVAEFAVVTPGSGEAQDFTSPVGYTVTAEDAVSSTVYTVTVTVGPVSGDTVAPVPGDLGALTLLATSSTTVAIGWTKATDDSDAQAVLEYKVVSSDADNIADGAAAIANGDVVQDWTADLQSVTAEGLTPEAVYWFNVLVRDGAGNTAAYASASVAALPARARIAGAAWAAGGLGGRAVALSADGSTLVVGAPGGATDRGVAYVFEKVSGVWTQKAMLTPFTRSVDDQFGFSVAVDGIGSTVVVGAPKAEFETNSGVVFVYDRPIGGWANKTEDFSESAYNGTSLGCSVAVSSDGSVVAAGGSGYVDVVSGQGIVVVLERSGSVWNGRASTLDTHAILTASDYASGDKLGTSVSISADGSVIVAGAPYAEAGGTDRGALYLFVHAAPGWVAATETKKLTRASGVDLDLLGSVVAISPDGSVIAAQASGADSAAGSVWIYVAGTGWAAHAGTENSQLPPPVGLVAGDSLGSALSLSSDAGLLAVGAKGNTVGSNAAQGSVYLYSRSGSAYASSPVEHSEEAAGAANDQLGASASLSGNGTLLVAGAPGEDTVASDAGAVFAFDL
jgi:hypothetical protein